MRTVSRRKFVAWAAATLFAGGGGLVALRHGGTPVPADIGRRLRSLQPWQYAVAEAVGGRITHPESADVGWFADGYLSDLPQADRRDLIRLLTYVEHVAPLLEGRLRRFSQLPAEVQDRVLRGLESSGSDLLRAGFQALKALSFMALYRREQSWSSLGYAGPVVRWEER
jgi:hypothetical protein